MGEILMSVMVNQNPVFGADSLPFVATGFDDAYKLWQAQKPVADRLLAKRGCQAVVCGRMATAGDLREEGAALGRRHEGA